MNITNLYPYDYLNRKPLAIFSFLQVIISIAILMFSTTISDNEVSILWFAIAIIAGFITLGIFININSANSSTENSLMKGRFSGCWSSVLAGVQTISFFAGLICLAIALSG